MQRNLGTVRLGNVASRYRPLNFQTFFSPKIRGFVTFKGEFRKSSQTKSANDKETDTNLTAFS